MKKESNPKPPEGFRPEPPNGPPKGMSPPPISSGVKCGHEFVFLNTICKYENAGYKHSNFYRNDTFFCTKCLAYRKIEFQTSGEKYPDWWIENK